jgi:hypothetical protein
MHVAFVVLRVKYTDASRTRFLQSAETERGFDLGGSVCGMKMELRGKGKLEQWGGIGVLPLNVLNDLAEVL